MIETDSKMPEMTGHKEEEYTLTPTPQSAAEQGRCSPEGKWEEGNVTIFSK